VGHWIEMGWVWLGHCVLGTELMTNILANPLEPYTIYGTGAVLIILVVRPMVKRLKNNIFAIFLVGALVCAILEYLSSVALVWRYGYNPYWWYIDEPFNLGGHICLRNSLLFGVLATLFLKLVYPFTEKLLKRGNQVVINIVLVVLAGMFVIYNVVSGGF
jgi:uncharacterized membrane protein